MPVARILHDGEPRLALLADGAWALLDTPPDELLSIAAPIPAQAIEEPVCLLGPLRPTKLVAIGLNYRDHIAEARMAEPSTPLVLAKLTSSVIGPDEPIVVDPELTAFADWEAELAVVVGRRARRVSVEQALEHVFGYTVANDVSARDLQQRDGQWARAKSLDTFCPLGPAVALRREIQDPQALRVRTWLNGELVQNGNTADMVFSVAELIAFCSHSFTLEPGDVLLTGTPAGVGVTQDPPRSLQPGDVVECEVEGLGRLRNPVARPYN